MPTYSLISFSQILGGALAEIFPFDAQDHTLHLERQPIGMTIRSAAAVVQPPQAVLLVALEELVARLSGNAELPAHHRHFLVLQQPGYKSNTLKSIGLHFL